MYILPEKYPLEIIQFELFLHAETTQTHTQPFPRFTN